MPSQQPSCKERLEYQFGIQSPSGKYLPTDEDRKEPERQLAWLMTEG